MCEILAEGSCGLIILLDCTRPNVFADLNTYLKAFSDLVEKKMVAIGITRMDQKPGSGINHYRDYLEKIKLAVPLFEVDARSKRDITLLLQALLEHMEAL